MGKLEGKVRVTFTGGAGNPFPGQPAPPLPCVRAFQLGEVDLLHPEHGRHRPLRAGGTVVLEHLGPRRSQVACPERQACCPPFSSN